MKTTKKKSPTYRDLRIRLTAAVIRHRKAKKSPKKTEPQILEDRMMEILDHPLLEKLPMGNMLKETLTYAICDLAEYNT